MKKSQKFSNNGVPDVMLLLLNVLRKPRSSKKKLLRRRNKISTNTMRITMLRRRRQLPKRAVMLKHSLPTERIQALVVRVGSVLQNWWMSVVREQREVRVDRVRRR